ncbi:hypothetical protein EZJ49_13980 [Bdellovibrio bacteriovorus]|uniref:hypothetical protein n=1 Tax=Bdellovibrio bacteriovorus TaxID=959 RepID=UPI0021D067FA|nr:hypothetical protein [Bdellovibrio bacteriovorus]UXR64171.1 hypothetical protein EZJ49_13980 [Bdellovibrio bacteriovorus]
MKTTIKLFGAMAAMMALSACAGGSGADVHTAPTQDVSVDAAGNCSSDYIAKYNSIVFEMTALDAKIVTHRPDSEIITQLRVVHNACEKFLTKHSNVSCKAEIKYKETTIDSTAVKTECDKIKTTLDSIERQ